MKHQQLAHLEAGWKAQYLLHAFQTKKLKCLERADSMQALEDLQNVAGHPESMQKWIKNYLTELDLKRLDQAIRARRKRYFDAEQRSIRKKSINLTEPAWKALAFYSKAQAMTLSEAVLSLLHDNETFKRSGEMAFSSKEGPSDACA